MRGNYPRVGSWVQGCRLPEATIELESEEVSAFSGAVAAPKP